MRCSPHMSEAIKKNTSNAVYELLAATGAKAYSWVEFENAGLAEHEDYVMAYSNLGYYMPKEDQIVICNKTLGNWDSTVLHELIHWSGAEDRTNRKFIKDIKNNTLSEKSFTKNLHTEEMAAEMGAIKLAAALGLDSKEHTARFENYKALYPLADLKKAKKLSSQAVKYLLSLRKETGSFQPRA